MGLGKKIKKKGKRVKGRGKEKREGERKGKREEGRGKGKGGREKEKGGRKGKREEKRGKREGKGGSGNEKRRKERKICKTFQVCPLLACIIMLPPSKKLVCYCTHSLTENICICISYPKMCCFCLILIIFNISKCRILI